MTKRKSPKEIIESDPTPENEIALIKFPRQSPINVSGRRSRGRVYIADNLATMSALSSNGKYSFIHTHPYNEGIMHHLGNILPFIRNARRALCFPSYHDLAKFLGDPRIKTAVIHTRGTKSGKIYDTCILRKTKETPSFQNNIYDKEVTKNYNIKVATDIISGNYTGAKRELDKLADEYRLQVKIIKERNTKGLDSKLMSIVSFISLLGAIFIFSSNFTGNVIGTKINSTSNWIGVIFFLVGLVGAFVYFRKNK